MTTQYYNISLRIKPLKEARSLFVTYQIVTIRVVSLKLILSPPK